MATQRSILEVLLRAKNEMSAGISSGIADLDRLGSGAGRNAALIGSIAAVGAVAIGTIGLLGQQAVSASADMGTLSRTTGLTVSELDELSFFAGQSNIEFESMVDSLGRVNVQMVAAREGSKSAGREFRRLGVDLDTLKDSGPAAVFEEVLTKLQAVEGQAERSRAAMVLFGTTDVLALDDITELRAELEGIGAVIDEDLVEASLELERTWDKIARHVKVFAADVIRAGRRGVQSDGGGIPTSRRDGTRASGDLEIFLNGMNRALPDIRGRRDVGGLGIPVGGPADDLSGFLELEALFGGRQFSARGRRDIASEIPVDEVEGLATIMDRIRDSSDAWFDNMLETRLLAETLGASFVDVAFAFSDNMAAAFADVIDGNASLVEGIDRAWRNMLGNLVQNFLQVGFRSLLGGVAGFLFPGAGAAAAGIGALFGGGGDAAMAAGGGNVSVNIQSSTVFGNRSEQARTVNQIRGMMSRGGHRA